MPSDGREAGPSRWPTGRLNPGLYLGWHGGAWMELQRERLSGAERSGLRAAVLRRLSARRSPSKAGHIGAFIGTGADPLIAALAARQDRAFRRLLPALITRWIRSSNGSIHRDLVPGSAGALLACAEIAASHPGQVPGTFVKSLAGDTTAALKTLLAAPREDGVLLGLAHGLSGHLLALESARTAFGVKFDASLREKAIDAIAEERVEGTRGEALWPSRRGRELMAEGWFDHGWCNGAPGIGLAFLAGFRLSGVKAYWQIARPALEGAYRHTNGSGSFCCGSVGRAQVLLEAYKHTGDAAWLKKARTVAAEKAGEGTREIRSFFLGRMGRRYLSWRLADPRLPFPGLGVLSLP